MESQFFLRMIFSAVILNYAHAETMIRDDFHFRLKIENTTIDNLREADVTELIKGLGLETDEESEIYIHEENNFIDLSCFSCITNNIPSNEEIQHSHNWRVEK